MTAKQLLIAIACVFLIGAVSTGTFLFFRNRQRKSTPIIVTASPSLSPAPKLNVEKSGVIQGELTYPNGPIPDTLTICAQSTATQEMYCTKNQVLDPQYPSGRGYQLRVNPGKYYVYAFVPEQGIDKRAYYSEFSVCRQNPVRPDSQTECSSHEPVELSVEPGANPTNVTPNDWNSKPTPR
jgi:hypothetical protein